MGTFLLLPAEGSRRWSISNPLTNMGIGDKPALKLGAATELMMTWRPRRLKLLTAHSGKLSPSAYKYAQLQKLFQPKEHKEESYWKAEIPFVVHWESSIQEKIVLLDNSIQKILKEQGDLKAIVESSIKSNSDQLDVLNSHSSKLEVISSALSVWSKQMQENLKQHQSDIFRIFTKEMEASSLGYGLVRLMMIRS